MTGRWWSIACSMLAVGCAKPGLLSSGAASELTRTAPGELVYTGAVFGRNVDVPLYRYERRVSDEQGGVRSSHTTFTLAGEPVVLHRAEHTEDYELRAFREVHVQTGRSGSVRVDDDGVATFETEESGRRRTRTESAGDPLHVGPTLFGFVLAHWDSLSAGDALRVRFVVLSKRRSYRFRLWMEATPTGMSMVRMVPVDPLVRMAIPSIRVVFDRERRVLTYRGPVPPRRVRGARSGNLNGTVVYEHHASTYR